MPPLDHLGFQYHDVRIITDTTPGDLPTKAKVDDAQPGDSFFFNFSGHGMQIRDTSGGGTGGLDECSFLCLLCRTPPTNRITPGICAIDYRGEEQLPNNDTDGVSRTRRSIVCRTRLRTRTAVSTSNFILFSF